jgi:hypothetical protein
MRRIHIAISVQDIPGSVQEYSRRLGSPPVVVVTNEYALWRTAEVNFSIRRVEASAGALRHLGFEDPAAKKFAAETDCNGILWEAFDADLQAREINDTWPDAKYQAE